jgi:hypothetical protein
MRHNFCFLVVVWVVFVLRKQTGEAELIVYDRSKAIPVTGRGGL